MAHNDIEAVAKLGLSLASSLQVHSEANRRARQTLPKLINLINSTALTLTKVGHLIQENEDALTKLCLEDIASLAATCEKIYIGVLIMLVRQTENVVGDKEINEIPREETGKYLYCIAHTSVWRLESWEWLEVQLRYFRHRLTQIKFELMLRYLLGSIAQHQMRALTRVPGSFETEYTIRMLAGQVASQRASHYKYWSKKVAKWTIITPPLPSSNVSLTDVNSTCTVSSTPTIALDTKVEEIKPVETMPVTQTPALELSKDTEVSPDTTAETTSKPTQIDQKSIKEHGSSLITATRNWIKRILVPGSHDEWKGQDLEVWQIDLGAHLNSVPSKTFKRLELDDKHVRSALSQVTSKSRWRKRPELLEQYDSLDQRVRQRIDEGVDAAKQSSSRERTWIAMSIASPPFKHRNGRRSEAAIQADASISLFFRLGDEVEPIHVFEPYSGKKLTFPYEAYKDLNLLHKRLSSLNLGFTTASIMKEGKYVFCTDDGTVILHEAWESLRRPGMTLNIQLVGVPIPPGWPVSNPQGRIPPRIIRPMNIGPSGNLPSANTTTSDSSSAYTCASPTMKQIHGEMEELLRLSDSWSPDPDTIGTGLGRLLGLWTNAPDPHVNVTEDSESEWSCSTGDSDYSSGSVSS
ncbi:hypothetical protein NOF04DRAFT_19456 [Fusarium oxysporum II5]|uniref:Ubiquitin-like domain-containing protein n=1 Tax=Fusarium odoratissimum (strain NRRL 54006) TaxID=1089451 RepID=X0IPH3_FUSO5|nr:uncharacterized protein FOIG_16006 [Fusarium odoratissimum NRRL 54006]EXL90798.1 hypothetical protein FOIG_16006 [Fusarium odoratissimum NRRL 54006]KAK2128943.1 hypothetical protein NOF04DRAFT_19456 [Fusarium oxysporum II5]